jgi:hypothetical protein
MDVQQPVAGELDEQVFAVGRREDQRGAVEQRGRLGEPALRAGHGGRPATEAGGHVERQAMQGMAFRHVTFPAGARSRRRTYRRPKSGHKQED